MTHGHRSSYRLHLPRAEILAVLLAATVCLDFGLVYLVDSGRVASEQLVHISSVSWVSNGSVLSSASGFTARAGSHIRLILEDTNCLLGCVAVNFTSLGLSPTSFRLVNASLPEILPGSTENLTVIAETPSTAYSGPLVIDLS